MASIVPRTQERHSLARDDEKPLKSSGFVGDPREIYQCLPLGAPSTITCTPYRISLKETMKEERRER
jgi:hypothetical protein